MREYRKAISEASKRKLDGIEKGEPHTKVDSSSWSPPPMLEADKQNGMRPVSPRQYKSGGKVHGEHSKKRADRKARKEGGRAMSVDGFINRDNKMANDEREGVKKIGGMKRGGKIKREHHADGDAVGNMIRQTEIEENMKNRGIPARVPLPPRRPVEPPVKYTGPRNPVADRMGPKHGGKIPAKHAKGGVVEHSDEAQDKKLMHKVLKPKAFKADGGEAGRGLYVREGYPHEVPGANGGRTARKHGGATKGKTHINIMIHPHGTQGGMPPAMPPMGGPMMPPPPPPRPPMPPMGGAPMGMPMGGPPEMPPMGAGRPGMPPIGRMNGGKVEHVIDHAAGGGLGRLEKIKAYGLK